jgi:uncharacterized membrane protein
MRAFFIPLGLTIVSNVLYHFAQKSVPRNADPMLALAVTYLVALAVTIVLLIAGGGGMPTSQSLRTLNWATIATGIAIVGVEIGFLLAYRSGLNVSLGAVTSNVAVALILLPAGVMFFRERLTAGNFAGIALCLAGLALIVR